MFDIIRGDKTRVETNWWEVLQKLIHSAQINAGTVFDVLFKSYGVVPDNSGCEVLESFRATVSTWSSITVNSGTALVKLPAKLFGDYNSVREVPVVLSVNSSSSLDVSTMPKDDDGNVQGFIALTPQESYVTGELTGYERFTNPVQTHDLIRRYEGKIVFLPAKDYKYDDTNNTIKDMDGNIVGYVLHEVGIPAAFFDESSSDYHNPDLITITDRRRPLVLSERILGYDPCALDLSALDMLTDAMVQLACKLLTLEDYVLDLHARVQEIETRIGIDSYDPPRPQICMLTDMMYPASLTASSNRDGSVKLTWENPSNYNYTHVAIYRAIKKCTDPAPDDSEYRLIAIAAADSKVYIDRTTELKVALRESREPLDTKMAKHYYKIVPATGLLLGKLESAPQANIVPLPYPVLTYTISSSSSTTVTINFSHMNDYIWGNIIVSDGVNPPTIYTRGDALVYTFDNRICQLTFTVTAEGCTSAPLSNTTRLSYVPPL